MIMDEISEILIKSYDVINPNQGIAFLCAYKNCGINQRYNH